MYTQGRYQVGLNQVQFVLLLIFMVGWLMLVGKLDDSSLLPRSNATKTSTVQHAPPQKTNKTPSPCLKGNRNMDTIGSFAPFQPLARPMFTKPFWIILGFGWISLSLSLSKHRGPPVPYIKNEPKARSSRPPGVRASTGLPLVHQLLKLRNHPHSGAAGTDHDGTPHRLHFCWKPSVR